MHRVIYTSRATRFFSAQGIEGLIATCRRKNAELELTGILVFHEGRFFQVLEGEEGPLMKTMETIVKDPRHTALHLSEHGAIEKRAFHGWRLGFAMPQDVPHRPVASFPLHDLLPPDSRHRGRDPAVRHHVRAFLSTLQQLPRAAAG